MADVVCLHAMVRGRVQGVAFRYFVLRKARSLDLKGYVHNLTEGHAVEVVAEGRREGLEELLRHLSQGPPGSAVEQVDTRWASSSGTYRDFRVVYEMPVDGPGNNISWAVYRVGVPFEEVKKC